MRSWYRETRYECGDYMEVNIYPVHGKTISRRKKAKPTKEVQQKLNNIYAENRIVRKGNANFTDHDLKVELTYSSKHLPSTLEEAEKELRKFIRKVKHYRKKNGLPELKYIATTETGKKNNRYHHHLIMSGGIDLYELVQMWGKGIVGTDLLVFDENGIASLIRYMLKQVMPKVTDESDLSERAGKKRYTCSRNLVDPPAKQRDNRFSKRQVVELAKNIEDKSGFEKLYQGYFLSGAKTVMSDINGGVYIYARLYREDAAWCNKKKTLNRSRSSAGRTSRNINIQN